jgi:hypothetical protein
MELSAAVAGFAFARDALILILNGTVEQKTRQKITDVLTRLGETQDTMFALREENFLLQDENARLKREAAQSDAWDKRMAELDLDATPGSATVYVNMTNFPPYYVCPRCVNDKRIEILQDKRTISGLAECPNCETNFMIRRPQRMPPIEYE